MPKSVSRTAPRRSGTPLSPALQKLRAAAEVPRGAEPLTARSVAELCGVELKTVHNWAAEELIPHFRTPGRHLRFHAEDVIRFLEHCGYRLPDRQRRYELLFVGSKATGRRVEALAREARVEVAKSPLEALVTLGRRDPTHLLLEATAFAQLSLEAYVRVVAAASPKVKIAVLGYRRALRRTARLTQLDSSALVRYLRS